MGIEAVKLNRTQYRKRRRTMDEMDAQQMTSLLVRYWAKQGAISGLLCGAAYGACFWSSIGLSRGGVYGALTGMGMGLIIGVVISAINAIQRASDAEERYFLWHVAYAAPLTALVAGYCIFHRLEPNNAALALIAAVAAWQAARKMGDWYFE